MSNLPEHNTDVVSTDLANLDQIDPTDSTADSSSFISNPSGKWKQLQNADIPDNARDTGSLSAAGSRTATSDLSETHSSKHWDDSYNKAETSNETSLHNPEDIINIKSSSKGIINSSDTSSLPAAPPTTGISTASSSSPLDSTPTHNDSHHISFVPASLPVLTHSDIEFQNSSFLDDTRAQFDLDINIDDLQIEPNEGKSSPWRNFKERSPRHSLYRSSNFLAESRALKESSTGAASSGSVEDLLKQLTNCKIQLKLYEKFLQDLISNNSIDQGEVRLFHSNLEDTTQEEMSKKINSENSTAKEISDMSLLVEDLYASLEEYQRKWREADKKASVLSSAITVCAREVSALLDRLGIETKPEVSAHIDTSPQQYLSEVLLHFPSDRILNSPELAPATDGQKSLHDRLRMSRQSTLDKSSFPKKELFGSESGSNDEHLSPASTYNAKLQEYQMIIDRLQQEVNDFKNSSRTGSLSDLSEPTMYSNVSRDREKFATLQRDYDHLSKTFELYSEEQERYKAVCENKIASLTSQLNSSKREAAHMRSNLTMMDSLQHDLDIAVEKQRILATEKNQLSYQVENLKQDKVAMQKTVEALTEKLTRSNGETESNQEALKKTVSDYSNHFNMLFELDVKQFEKLIKSFNKIADESSLQEPRKNVEYLSTLKGSKVLEQSNKLVSAAKEAHKSASDYFARAVDVIVNDHIRLLLNENEKGLSNEKFIKELKAHISALEDQNKQMSERLEVLPSPRSKLRIEELTTRWKAEREARVLENRQAKKRLKELESNRT